MPRISAPELAAKLRRRFEMTGESSIDTLSPEIVGVIVLEDYANQKGGDDELCHVAIAGTASGAGNQNTNHLINRAGSGVILAVELVYIQNASGNDRVDMTLVADPGGGTTGQALYRDGRLSGVPQAIILNTQAVAAVVQGMYHTPAVPGPSAFPIEFVLAPGDALRVRQNNQNQELITTFVFRERPVTQKGL